MGWKTSRSVSSGFTSRPDAPRTRGPTLRRDHHRPARRSPTRRATIAAAPVPCTACPASTRSGRSARRRARHPLDQDDGQDAGDRPGRLDGRPDHARGRRHPRQGPRRCAPRPAGPTPTDPTSRRSRPSASTRTSPPWPSRRCAGSGVGVAAVATAFPSGRASLPVKLADTAGRRRRRRRRDRHGDRPRGVPRRPLRPGVRRDRRRQGRPAVARTSRSSWRPASWHATTTSAAPPGWRCSRAPTSSRRPPARSPPPRPCPCAVLLQAVRDWHRADRRGRGVKPAGGIRTAKDAIRHLVAVNEVAGPEWLDPALFRFGASILLNDLLLQRRRLAIGPLRLRRPPDAELTIETPCGFRVRPRAASRGDRRRQAAPTACSSTASSSTPPGRLAEDAQPGHGGGAGRGRPARRRRRRPGRRRRARRAYDRVWGPMPGAERAKYLFRIARILAGALARAGRAGDPRQRQADPRVAATSTCRSAAAHFFYHAGWADKLEYAGLGADPQPLGVAGAGHPVELPAADGSRGSSRRRSRPATPWCSSPPRRRR